MNLTAKAIAKLINRDYGYVRVLLKRRKINIRFTKLETSKLSDRYMANLKKVLDLISEYK